MNDGKDEHVLAAPAPPGPNGPGIVEVRGERVVLDADLARLFDVETRVFNQAFKRNRDRFPDTWAFELTNEEVGDLRSRSVIPSGTWGGRRTPPWAFTEHGVVMAATLLTTDRSKAALQLVVDVFVRARRGELGRRAVTSRNAHAIAATGSGTFGRRLRAMIERLMDAMVDQGSQRQLRDEAQAVFQDSIGHIRARLGKAGYENEEIAARATKLLAEAEASKASAAKTRAEADEIALRTLARKLTMVLEADRAMIRGEMEGFLAALKELGGR